METKNNSSEIQEIDYQDSPTPLQERIHMDGVFEKAFNNIIEFNIKKGLSNQGINVKRGTAYIIEELMEMFEENLIPRETALRMVEQDKMFRTPKQDMHIILDSYGDIIVFAIGEMFKTLIALGNSEEDAKDLIAKIMLNITQANLNKCLEKDKEGKLMKGEGFCAPEIPLTMEGVKNE